MRDDQTNERNVRTERATRDRERSRTSLELVLFACAFSGALGCGAIESSKYGETRSDRGRFEYALNDKESAEDWANAVSPDREEDVESAASKIPVLCDVRGAVGDEEIPPTLSQRFKNMFHIPNASDRPIDADDDLIASKRYAQRPIERETYRVRNDAELSASRREVESAPSPKLPPPPQQEPKSESFWSKISPFKGSTKKERELEQDIVELEVTTPSPRAGSRQKTNADAKTESDAKTGSDAPAKENKKVERVASRETSSSRSWGSLNLGFRKKNAKSNIVNDKYLCVDQYDQSRFLPPFSLVKEYYEPSADVSSKKIAADERSSEELAVSDEVTRAYSSLPKLSDRKRNDAVDAPAPNVPAQTSDVSEDLAVNDASSAEAPSVDANESELPSQNETEQEEKLVSDLGRGDFSWFEDEQAQKPAQQESSREGLVDDVFAYANKEAALEDRPSVSERANAAASDVGYIELERAVKGRAFESAKRDQKDAQNAIEPFEVESERSKATANETFVIDRDNVETSLDKVFDRTRVPSSGALDPDTVERGVLAVQEEADEPNGVELADSVIDSERGASVAEGTSAQNALAAVPNAETSFIEPQTTALEEASELYERDMLASGAVLAEEDASTPVASTPSTEILNAPANVETSLAASTPSSDPLSVPANVETSLAASTPSSETLNAPANVETSLAASTSSNDPLSAPANVETSLAAPAPSNDPLSVPANVETSLAASAPSSETLNAPTDAPLAVAEQPVPADASNAVAARDFTGYDTLVERSVGADRLSEEGTVANVSNCAAADAVLTQNEANNAQTNDPAKSSANLENVQAPSKLETLAGDEPIANEIKEPEAPIAVKARSLANARNTSGKIKNVPLEERVETEEAFDAANETRASEELVAQRDALETERVVSRLGAIDERKTGAKDDAPLTQEEIAWIEYVKNAIRSLLAERKALSAKGEDVSSCDARLRLLYLAIDEYDRAIQEIESDDDPLKRFWETECRGLETLLRNQLDAIDPNFVADSLRSGYETFSSLCNARIRKAVWTTAPACYGLYEKRETPFKPGEVACAYCELDYIVGVATSEGYSIDVECRWRWVDPQGNALTSFETQRCRNVSETKLRDVVLNVSAPVPPSFRNGLYALEIEVVDLNANERNTSTQRLIANVVE